MVTFASAKIVAAFSSSPMTPWSSAAATSRSERVAAGRSEPWFANACSRRAVSGSREDSAAVL
jgi:hypothetical protein